MSKYVLQKLYTPGSQELSPKPTQFAQKIIKKRKSNSNINNPYQKQKKTNTDKQIQSNLRYARLDPMVPTKFTKSQL